MSINLPDFDNPFCHSIIACSEVKTRSRATIALLESRKVYETTYVRGGRKCWALAVFGGGGQGHGGKHFHLEATSVKPTKRKLNEGKRIEVDDFLSLIGVMVGKSVAVSVTGHFFSSLDDIPEDSLIRPAFFEITKGRFSFLTTRMEFEFDGMVFPQIAWRMLQGRDGLAVRISGRVAGKIDPDYLTRFIHYMDASYESIVLGQTPDA